MQHPGMLVGDVLVLEGGEGGSPRGWAEGGGGCVGAGSEYAHE